MTFPRNNQVKLCRTHPIAWQQQKLMLAELKSLPNYVETEIHHDWDIQSNSITWSYSFDIENNPSWEATIKEVVIKYNQP